VTADRTRLPAVGPEVAFRFPHAERVPLPCGLELHTIEHRDVPVLAFLLLVTAGSAEDPDDRPGLAALTADLLDEGAGDRSALDVHDALARIGGQFDTETGYDATVVTLVTLPRFRDRALDLLADLAFRPRLSEDDFARVRALRRSRLLQMRDAPAAVAEQTFARHLFGRHPYGHLPIGTVASIDAIAIEDVRAFHAQRYCADGTVLIAVGDDTHDAMAEAVTRVFVPPVRGAPARRVAADEPDRPAAPGAASRRLVVVDRPGAPQSELRVGRIAAPRGTPDYEALVTLNSVLGGQFVSRINLNLREDKGYTYGARTGFDFRRRPGPFVAQGGVQTPSTADAIREMVREIDEIRTSRPPTDRELTLARAALTLGYPRNFETAEQLARALAQQVLHGLPDDYYDRFVHDIRAVDAGAVARAADRWLTTADLLAVVVGDRARIIDELGTVGFGEPLVVERGE
jgi:zinc protease